MARDPINLPLSDEAVIRDFAMSLQGELIRPGDTEYEEARRVWNGAVDKYPSFIARCASVEDVVEAVKFARSHTLPLAIRGGGHSGPGHSSVDGGLVIDLVKMRSIQVDPNARTVRAEAGCTLGELDRATQEFGLAVPAGQVTHTGIAGLTLGGGTGWLMRKYGLTIDNLLSVELVTADGRVLTVSDHENADLFWGVRGGGGNFGVVTSFEYRLHPVGPILPAGPVVYTLDIAADALRFYREFMATAPDELTAFAILATAPAAPPFPEHLHGKQVLLVDVCYAGPTEEGMRVLQPLKAYGMPDLDLIGPMPFTARQSLADASDPPGMLHYYKGEYLRELSDEAIETAIAHFVDVPSPASAIHIARIGGAVARVPETATAFGDRDAPYLFWIMGSCGPDGDLAAVARWAADASDAMGASRTGGVYVNMLEDEGEERVKAAYGAENYARLVELKNKYDPANLFRLNQNIRPSV